MAHFSNVIINDGSFKFNSAQGDLHIHNRDSESGMHFRSIQKSTLIDDPMKDFIP
jgi:hypothetical protein